MSLLAQILRMDCRQVVLLEPQKSCLCGVISVRMFHRLPQLSRTSLEVARAEDKEGARRGYPRSSQQHPSLQRVKSLKEMPGPKTFSNLVEFFWKGGFARIHEIQVQSRSRITVGTLS